MLLFSIKSNKDNLLNYLKTTTRTGAEVNQEQILKLKQKEDFKRKETNLFPLENKKSLKKNDTGTFSNSADLPHAKQLTTENKTFSLKI